ncbi:DUF4160 domain-containing protein [Bradyrhizobium sp.]|uniref:DUF4160 domain-containing protein n=1 Tax=Bradyrhizobium sp. TaxID=376 RepID=UPI003C6F63B4
MPTILRWGPYRAFFYSNERDEPPHVHVRAGDQEAKFWLHDLSVATNTGFPAHEIYYPLSEIAPRTARKQMA